jgi:hypothetical protein
VKRPEVDPEKIASRVSMGPTVAADLAPRQKVRALTHMSNEHDKDHTNETPTVAPVYGMQAI